ncbi:MAG TPA: phage Gp37/Gp68 family protein [Devosia sp.]|jgi:protein gp37|nr:phage Gp37/Gp68 family protein [Devosia sp.]
MAETSAIEWTDATFNPWIGCTKISPACDHCYAEALMDTRHHRVKWGGDRSRTSASNWQLPRRWQRQAAQFFAEHGRRRRVFCASLADVFDNQVPTEWRDDLWALIYETPDIDWLLLTKRPQNIAKMLPSIWDGMKGHVWLGTTIEDQERDRNLLHLCKHDAAVRFISYEPAIGPLDVSWAMGNRLDLAGRYLERGMFSPGLETLRPLDWVIAGGESGAQARPSHPDWFRSLRDQCAAAGVPFLFKQWGEYAPYGGEGGVAGFWLDPDRHVYQSPTLWPPADNERRSYTIRYGKKRAGRLIDGIEHNGFPAASSGRIANA